MNLTCVIWYAPSFLSCRRFSIDIVSPDSRCAENVLAAILIALA